MYLVILASQTAYPSPVELRFETRRSDSAWVDAVDLIRSLRTYELKAVPRLQPALCDRCERRPAA